MSVVKQAPFDLSISPFDVINAHQVSAIANRSYEDAFGEILTDQGLQDHHDKLSPAYFIERVKNGDTIFIAKHKDDVIGFIQYTAAFIPESQTETGDLELDKLYIDPASQGHGAGKMLMEVSLAHPKIASAPHVFLLVWNQNSRAIALYKSFGFNEIGERKFRSKDGAATNLIMIRDQRA